MDIQIRLEQPADYSEAEQVTREAFWNHYSPGCTEHYLLHVMRNSPKPTLIQKEHPARLL